MTVELWGLVFGVVAALGGVAAAAIAWLERRARRRSARVRFDVRATGFLTGAVGAADVVEVTQTGTGVATILTWRLVGGNPPASGPHGYGIPPTMTGGRTAELLVQPDSGDLRDVYLLLMWLDLDSRRSWAQWFALAETGSLADIQAAQVAALPSGWRRLMRQSKAERDLPVGPSGQLRRRLPQRSSEKVVEEILRSAVPLS